MSQFARGFRWTGWRNRKPSLIRPFPVLRFEALEDRTAPAITYTWSGAGGDNKWATDANWVGGIHPTGDQAVVESLVFPSNVPAAAKATDNNLPANAVFNSISFGAGGYTLSGNPIILGIPGVSSSGVVSVASGAAGNILAINTRLGASSGVVQTFTVNSGADLTVSGQLTGTTGSTLTKDGTGILRLTNDNSGFTGSINVNSSSGVLLISHPLALGDTSAPTTVGTNSSLQIASGTGTINESLRLNGLGVANDGALNNLAGTNTWAGGIILDSNSAIGAAAGVLEITGKITDTGTGHNLKKEGIGEVRLSSPTGNTYRGLTEVNNGILTVTHPLALGTITNGGAGTAASGTVVHYTLVGAGQLRLEDPTGAGFTVKDEFLTLNGDAQGPGASLGGHVGSLTNTIANNTWAGPVTLGSPPGTSTVTSVTIGAAAGTNLTISGVISSPHIANEQLIKQDTGRLILNNANTYTGQTSVQEGILNVRDSMALGSTGAGTTVSNGAALELEVEAANPTTVPRFDAHNRDLWDDSVTHDPHRLWVSEPLTITGRGVNNTGALRSISGINRYIVNAGTGITLSGGEAAIGVDQDQRPGHPTPNSSYFINDYSLTVGDPATNLSAIAGGATTTFVKRNAGHLILPIANPFTSTFLIEQGWVTVQNNTSLGARIPGRGDTVQPPTRVNDGAALHIKPLTSTSPPLVIPENLSISGIGPVHPYAFISQKGALMNLGGDNKWTGDIGLIGPTGIGVEKTDAASPTISELTVTGSTSGAIITQNFSFTASGDDQEFAQVIDTGGTSGTITIDYEFYGVPDFLRVYYPPRAQGGTTIIDTGVINGGGTVSANFGPGASTQIEVVMNEGGGEFGTVWDLFNVSITTTGGASGILKFGSKRLNLQGDGRYSGATEVREGTLRAQNDTALGQGSSGTLVAQQSYIQTDTVVWSGAVLQLDRQIDYLNGGIASGLGIWNERLILNSPAQQIAVAGDTVFAVGTFRLTFNGSASTDPISITATAADVANALNALPEVAAAGGVTVTRSGNIFTVIFGTAQDADIPLMQVVPGSLTSDAEVTISGATIVGGNPTNASLVNLTDDTSWRDSVTINNSARIYTAPNTRLSLLGPIDDATNTDEAGSDLVKRGTGALILAGNNTFRGTTLIDVGILTAMSSTAFGATLGPTVVSNGAQLQIEGSLTFAGEALMLEGDGPNALPNFPVRWFETGAAPTNNGLSPQNLPTSGRVTSVASDPSDPNVIYVATAGGGAWKTKNGGLTWLQLFDTTVDANAVMFGGAIAVATSDPRVIYFGTGEANGGPNGQPIPGPSDSYAGSGVYKSTDSGATWTLLNDPLYQSNPGLVGTPKNQNPLFGQSITKIIVDPINANLIYVASSDRVGLNGFPTPTPPPVPVPPQPAGTVIPAGHGPGVWRFDGTAWRNLVDNNSVSPARRFGGTNGQAPYNAPVVPPPNTGGVGPPGTAGPDDEYRIVFPQINATWSDLALIGGTLYAALGESQEQAFVWSGTAGTAPTSQAIRNAVYRTANPTSNNPTWLLGTAGADNRPGNGFPVGTITNANGPNGYIKISALSPAGGGQTVVYASVVQPPASATAGELLSIQRSTDGGVSYTQVATQANFPSAPFGLIPNALGRYDHSLLAYDPDPSSTIENVTTTVYLAGKDNIYVSTNSGAAWTAITPDANGGGPGRQFHSIHFDNSTGSITPRLLAGSDGGVWRWDGASWFDLNGDMVITQLNSADQFPTEPHQALAGAQDNGTQQFNNSLAWQRVDDTAGTDTVATGVVRYDPKNPLTAYAVRNGQLRKTTDGAASWTTIRTVTGSINYFPLHVDPVNPNRLLIGGDSLNALFESINGGATWVNLQANMRVTAIGAATFQGQFVADPGFTTVIDRLSNTYDPDTIYVTDGSQLRLTKNRGVTWVTRTPPIGTGGTITDIAVDPSNRDTLYVTVSRGIAAAGSRVYRSTNAGRTWTDITGDLPTIPTWKIITDPRSGTAYIGNDNGVWTLPNARDTSSFTWTRFGAGMPRVQVKDIVLNQQLNMLTAGTYGRSMYQAFLTDFKADSGALSVISGSSVWTGPVTLTGETWMSASGTQQIQNGIAAAQLDIIGVISDDVTGPHLLHKIGLGTIIFSGSNTYGGQTRVEEGVLRVNNPHALGDPAPAANTIVFDGAALELRTDLELEPVVLNGNGILFNQHFTGALRNISNNNVYTGELTLNTDTTIGVDSGSSLTIGARPDVLLGVGTVTDGGASFGFDKELPGTLILANANTYDGLTRVVAGALQVQHGDALGTPGVGTQVLDGAQIQIARNAATLAPTVVTSEPLSLSGTGINDTGAMLNVRGDTDPTGINDNVWQGPITLTIDPNFFPQTTPGTVITIGVSDPADTLTLDTVIDEDSTPLAQFGLNKVGPGRLTLTQANEYSGVTNVNEGIIRVAHDDALGPFISSEVQTLNVIGTTGTYRLSFNGVSTGNIPATASAAFVQAQLALLSTIGTSGGIDNVLVSETPSVNGKVLTVTFRVDFLGVNVPQLVASPTPGLTVNVATAQQGALGTVVAAGAGLEIGSGLGSPINVAEVLTLNGDGVNGAGALHNVAGDNAYTGPVTLASDTTLGALAGTSLTVFGPVQDPQQLTVPAARLRKAGDGTVVLAPNPPGNPYGGKTVVDEGVLRIEHALALGVARPEVQAISVFGTTGSLTLTFKGAQTTLTLPVNAAGLASALNGLLTIGGEGGSVGVTPLPVPGGTEYIVTFGGTLANTNVPQITTSGTAIANSRTRQDGNGPEVQTVTVVATTGSFRLRFDGQQTNPLAFNSAASLVEAELNALPAINSQGSVVVTAVFTPSANMVEYTIRFAGGLANANQPQITAEVVTPGPLLNVGTAQDGPEGTEVTDGATLQVTGDITMTDEVVTINGPGFEGHGALNNFSGFNFWAIPLILGSNSSVGTTNLGDILFFQAPITDEGNGYNLDVVDPGVVAFVAAADNQYTGTTHVKDGVLALAQSAGTTAILGPLVVGGEQTPALAVALEHNMIADTSPVTVDPNGVFDLGGMTDTIDKLTVTEGTVATNGFGSGGSLTVASIGMTGGTIEIASGGEVVLNGNVTAASSTTGAAILGPGTLQLNGFDRTLSVADSPQLEDLRISAQLGATGGEKLVKTDAGRVTFFDTIGFPVPIQVQLGDVHLQPGAAIGPVQLAGGSLSGTGTVGTLSGNSPAVGTVSPGVAWAANPAGTIQAEATTWGPLTTFVVNLSHTGTGAPVAGVDYDQLQVNGAITLGGANLQATFGSGIVFGDRFTIISATGGVFGKLAEPFGPNVVFIQGQKFRVDYSNSNEVVLEKIKADVTVTLISSANPSTLGQQITFNAIVTPEAGAGSIPITDTVTFTLVRTSPASPPVSLTRTVQVNASGIATLDPQAVLGGPLPGGTYTLTATFNGDDLNFNTGTGTLVPNQVVEVPFIEAPTVNPVVASPNNPTSPGILDTVSISTTVREERASTTWTVTIKDASNAAVRTYSGPATITGNTFPISVIWDGRNDLGGFVPDGTYSVTASFADVFGNTGTTAAVSVLIDNTTPTADTLTNSSRVIAPGTAATVPSNTELTSTVGDTNLDNWTLTINNPGGPVRTFTGNTPSVSVIWDGRNGGGSIVPDGEYTASLTVRDLAGNRFTTAPVTIVVMTTGPSVTVTSNTPSTYGQSITFTTTVSVPFASVQNLLDGDEVEFFRGTTPLGTANLALNGGQYRASIIVPTFDAGTYSDITAVYHGTSEFLESTSAQYTHVVNQAVLTVVADNKSKVYGQPVPPLTFTATGLVNGDQLVDVLSGQPATSATQSSPVAQYTITQGSLTIIDSNYTMSFTPGTLDVTRAPLTVNADPKSKVYGAPVPALTFSVNGLVNGDTITSALTGALATSATQSSPVNTYPITQGTLAAANYAITFNGATLTVTPAPLTITANDATRQVNTPNPQFTATFSGLVLGETPSVVSGLNLTTTATTSSPAGQYSIFSLTTPTAQNYNISFVPGTLTVTAAPVPPVPPSPPGPPVPPVPPTLPPTLPLTQNTAAGSGLGSPAEANLYSPTGRFIGTIPSFDPAFTGGVRTSVGDFTGDGVPDLAVGTGPGTLATVRVLDGRTLAEIFRNGDVFGGFTGGVFVAAGDLNGDGRAELVVTPDQGGGPRVAIFLGGTFARSQDFLGINDTGFRGGARPGLGDMNGDGIADLAISAGFLGGPRTAVYEGRSTLTGRPVALFNDFFTFSPDLRNGAFVAIGDVNGDGFGDLIAGAGPGGGPEVKVYSGKDLLAGLGSNATLIADFLTGDINNRDGVRVAAKNLDGDNRADIVTGGESRVIGYLAPNVGFGFATEHFGLDAFPTGVFVG